MMVTFRSKASADVVMFDDVAIRLIKLMGHSGTVPGALLAEDIDGALIKLKQAIGAEKSAPEGNATGQLDEDDSDQPAVSLAIRAWPLIEFLTASAAAKCNVMWE
ncbi:MAG: DUF1840 domain-containing protein [Gammaproteobacteria bacterium]